VLTSAATMAVFSRIPRLGGGRTVQWYVKQLAGHLRARCGYADRRLADEIL